MMNLPVTFSHGLLHMDISVLANQQRLTFISSVRTLDTVNSTYEEIWPIEMDSERESKESVLMTRFDDDEDDDILASFVYSCNML